MCQVRKISCSEFSKNNTNEIYNYLIENKKGQILIVKDNTGKVIGGVLLVFQGITVRFFRGTSDPDRRELPVLHLALYEAIKTAKTDNFKYFDFWGYNHVVDENDQVYNINHFKKGFGGYYTFFAKNMNISLIPYGYYINKTLFFVKKLIRKLL